MQTIEEAAKEAVQHRFNLAGVIKYGDIYEQGFKAGACVAQRWIPVEEELPVFEGKKFQILVKGHKDNPDKVVCWTVGIAENESIIRSIFTHWRPIELK